MNGPLYLHMHGGTDSLHFRCTNPYIPAASPEEQSTHYSLGALVCRPECLQMVVSSLFGCSFAPIVMKLEVDRALTALGERQARPEKPVGASRF